MRLNYADDEEFSGQFALWKSNSDRSLRGKRGQASLRELESALLEMPVKELVREVFVEHHGPVCALGALAVSRWMRDGLSRQEALDVCSKIDPDSSQNYGERMGVPRPVVWQIIAQNDVINGYHLNVEYTPVERYDRMLAWVREQIRPLVSDVLEAT